MKTPNLELYRASKPQLIKHVKQNGIAALSFFCACTGLPVYVACCYVKEDLPQFSEEVDKKITSLVEFYGYEV